MLGYAYGALDSTSRRSTPSTADLLPPTGNPTSSECDPGLRRSTPRRWVRCWWCATSGWTRRHSSRAWQRADPVRGVTPRPGPTRVIGAGVDQVVRLADGFRTVGSSGVSAARTAGRCRPASTRSSSPRGRASGKSAAPGPCGCGWSGLVDTLPLSIALRVTANSLRRSHQGIASTRAHRGVRGTRRRALLRAGTTTIWGRPAHGDGLGGRCLARGGARTQPPEARSPPIADQHSLQPIGARAAARRNAEIARENADPRAQTLLTVRPVP